MEQIIIYLLMVQKLLNSKQKILKLQHIPCVCQTFQRIDWQRNMWWRIYLKPSNCQCECDKSCDVGDYLDYGNCKCRKRLIVELVEECAENIDEVKIAEITSSEDENKCKSSCTIYVVLIETIFTISIGIGTYFIY